MTEYASKQGDSGDINLRLIALLCELGVETFPFIDETFMTIYTLLTGVTVEEMPKAAALVLPDKGGRFTYRISQSGNQLQVVSRMALRKPVYFAEEYPHLRELFALVIQTFVYYAPCYYSLSSDLTGIWPG